MGESGHSLIKYFACAPLISSGLCDPDMIPLPPLPHGVSHSICIFSVCDIPAGEEITYDYGLDTADNWKDVVPEWYWEFNEREKAEVDAAEKARKRKRKKRRRN